MSVRPALITFLGDLGSGRAELMVGRARFAATFDSIEAALASGAFSRAVLATDDAELEMDVAGVAIDVDDGPFHFGRRLAGVLRKQRIKAAVYMGGGSVPLFTGEDLKQAAEMLEGGRAVTNNAFSSDVVAFRADKKTLAAVESVDRDNALARALEDAGQTLTELPRSLKTLFDIDGPTDLAVLKLAGWGGRRLQSSLAEQEICLGPYEAVLPLFTGRKAQIVVAGRVGSHAWQYLERETACRVRLFAEERGLEAEGRARDGTARSLVGFFLEAAGAQRFYERLAELGDAAFIDTRVLLAHMQRDADREDRFLSDLGEWELIKDPFLRELTLRASRAPIPVLLGGHSLMSGGLMALNEFAWQRKEAAST